VSDSASCPFCPPESARVFLERPLIFAIWDGFPVAPGHALIIPRRHTANFFDLTPDEAYELFASIPGVRRLIDERHRPQGYNLGINVGRAAGQTVPHVHLHVIPRYDGDVPDPRGGVRYVIPGKAHYLSERADLVTGGAAPEDRQLVNLLKAQIRLATHVDILSAFIQRSGLELILPALQDAADRGRTVRILTGDYLGLTDPGALRIILDMPPAVQAFVFESQGQSFHPKAYIFRHEDEGGLAFVGSSNLSRPALTDGIEWNYPIQRSLDEEGFLQACSAFEVLLDHPKTRRLDYGWIESYERRRAPSPAAPVMPEPPPQAPEPHGVQRAALLKLQETRRAGFRKGLVQMATGLGKTYLAAFDSREFKRVLFVAHRDEILDQAQRSFRAVRPTASMGGLGRGRHDLTADILFASVQTLSRTEHLEKFGADAFDYIVVDEFHHASAKTYRRILERFQPRFLLGLTATPERTDGGDLMALCDHNLVFQCDLFEGIRLKLLSPFHYYGVPDDIDYANIPWRNSQFDEKALTNAWATERRAENAFEWHRKNGGIRTLAFCCSIRHANYMRGYFQERGVESRAVHSGEGSDLREQALEELAKGIVRVVFAVDLFNEGLDVPAIDTVLMLRPTESRILWLQQFGRGLRIIAGKSTLTVLDYIGNHRSFLLKPQALLGLGVGDKAAADALDAIAEGRFELPEGCAVTYDPQAIQILRSVLKLGALDTLQRYYEYFQHTHQGIRPTAAEAFVDGFSPRAAWDGHGSWLGFLASMNAMTLQERAAFEAHREFFEALERTKMERSYKMVTLLAMLALDRMPGSVSVSELADQFERILGSDARLSRELTQPRARLERSIVENPIAAWVGGRGMEGRLYFSFEGGRFGTTFMVEERLIPAFRELLREIVEWRLEEYEPSRVSARVDGEAKLWHEYSRQEIPSLFGLPWNAGVWGQQGFIVQGQNVFLLVTLDKKGKPEAHRYQDGFASRIRFRWQSQNRTTRESRHGKLIRESPEVHLFVRNSGRRGLRPEPFVYCGRLGFREWEGDKPISVVWELESGPIPDPVWARLGQSSR
jgi:superfamily II DNA or RNA helicase/diadenosine tetraphosphate (Ap4A) HIT family hydrolase